MKKNPTQMDSIEKEEEEKTLSQIDCCQREEVYLYGGCVLTRDLFRKERKKKTTSTQEFSRVASPFVAYSNRVFRDDGNGEERIDYNNFSLPSRLSSYVLSG